MEPRHSLFRERAWQEYVQTQEKEVRPKFMPSSACIALYILLFTLALVGIPVWGGEIPVFTNGPGVVLPGKVINAASNNPIVVMLFLPANYASQIQTGTSTQMSVESVGQQFTGVIKHVNTGVLSSDEARKLYKLNNAAAQAIPQSSVAVTIVPAATDAPRLRSGDLVSARVQIGSQRILSMLLRLR